MSLWPLILCVSLALCVSACGRKPPSPAAWPQPQVSGTLAVEGLLAPVRIVRDKRGVPHIYATTQDDLFFAQGFVQAQDRLWQMDLWRRSSQGRLSEVLGANFIERDAMTRRMQYRGDLRAEWASYGPDTEAIAAAFVRGINRWIDVAGEQLPREFALSGWRPDHWVPEDLLNRTDAFVASGDAANEVFRARLAAAVGPRAADALTAGAFDRPTEVPRELDVRTISPVIDEALRRVGTAPFFSGFAVAPGEVRLKPDPTYGVQPYDSRGVRLPPSREALRRTAVALAEAGQADLTGSNAWAIADARSTTGAPLLATDPHRALDHPSRRYLVHLNAPGWNVIGAAAPWLPGVVIGHNDRVAWGMTSRAADVQDLFVEKVNPANPHQVEDRGRWVDTEVVADPIVVRGREKPFPFEREYTPRGVLIASDRERHLAFVVRWTGFLPGTAAELGSLALDRARTDEELQAALDRWKLPGVTVISATADEGVRLRQAGWTPVRRGWNGALPAPGWTGKHDWEPDDRRSVDRPVNTLLRPTIVAIAANSIARQRRIESVLSGARLWSIDDFKALQHDTLPWNADHLVPLLARLKAERPDIEAARVRLMAWDRHLSIDSDAATLYVLWERLLLRKLVEMKIGRDLIDDFVSRAPSILVTAITSASAAWFGSRATTRRDELLLTALAAAVDAPEGRQNGSLAPWGALHTALFRHPLALNPAMRERLNAGPFQRRGYGETVMSTGGKNLEQETGATFSAIFDVGSWDRSIATNAPGQSGVAGNPHFTDLARGWSSGEYFQLPFSDEAVKAATDSTLTLTPR